MSLARFDDHRYAELESERDELVALLLDALDQYEAGGSDLSSLVHDIDSVIVELTLLADPAWIGKLRNQWKVLACALVARGRAGTSELAEPRVADAIQGLRYMA